ncbi:MAG: hypothetical protein U0T81_03750 [Saprospiraceae bacterium]
MAREEGILLGYSAGSALAGLHQLKNQLKPEDTVVLIFHDHGSRYVGKICKTTGCVSVDFWNPSSKCVTWWRLKDKVSIPSHRIRDFETYLP